MVKLRKPRISKLFIHLNRANARIIKREQRITIIKDIKDSIYNVKQLKHSRVVTAYYIDIA